MAQKFESQKEFIFKCQRKFVFQQIFFRSEVKNDLKVPEKPKLKCRGFSYCGAKLYNKLPCYIRQSTSSSNFKSHAKEWIWMNIPSC